MTRRRYDAHEPLVAPARARPQLWRILAGLIVVAAVVVILNTTLHRLIGVLAPGYWGADQAAGNTPVSMLVLLGSFGFLALGTGLAARLLHLRPVLGLIGPMPLAVAQFWRVLRMLLVLGLVVMVLPPWDMGASLRSNLPLATWLLLLPLSLAVVLIQSGAEELLFRGYLQQALAARFRSPWVWAGLPAALFAAGHYAPTDAGANAGLIAVWAGLFGWMMADLTARAGTLGPAIAVHLFNNATALLLVALPGSLNGLALYVLPFDLSDSDPLRAWLAVDLAFMAVAWLAARLAIRV
jgi:membrane protease YdiL (CAAX protease family)